MTHDLILHHYAGSPFSEKVRLVLGYKGLSWKSVSVPVILPKPDVVALTGGYRFLGSSDAQLDNYDFEYRSHEVRFGLEYDIPVDLFK